MNTDLLLVACLSLVSGYILNSIFHGFKIYCLSANFVEKISQQSLVFIGTMVYKVSYIDQVCTKYMESAGKTEEAKVLRIQYQQEFEEWKNQIVNDYATYYPEDYKWQLEFDDWKGMMDELTDIYKEKQV
jgi:hypothetical protein